MTEGVLSFGVGDFVLIIEFFDGSKDAFGNVGVVVAASVCIDLVLADVTGTKVGKLFTAISMTIPESKRNPVDIK